MTTPVLLEDTIQAGASWSLVLRRGRELRIEDMEGGANVAALFYYYECPVERYNMPDTLKAQHTAHLTKGFVLYSDMGRVLCSVTEDSIGWHDPLGGQLMMPGRWPRKVRGVELSGPSATHGIGIRATICSPSWRSTGLACGICGANVNFFSKVVVGPDGAMQFAAGNSHAGDSVTLRAEMNLLVVLETGQHPLDPNPRYAPKPAGISVAMAAPVAEDDLCRLSRPENGRGFINTERYFLW